MLDETRLRVCEIFYDEIVFGFIRQRARVCVYVCVCVGGWVRACVRACVHGCAGACVCV